MKILPTAIAGVMVIEPELLIDDRGYFARSFCAKDFADAGLEPMVTQANLSFNYRAGTVRGLHLQADPAAEVKLVRCTRGAIVDVAIDVRPDSPTWGQHVAVELTADNHRALYLPRGCAHGYQTLVDDTEVAYQVSAPYTPSTERGFRHDDPAFGITWPLPISSISPKDAAWPLVATR